MSLFHAQRLFKDARLQLPPLTSEPALPSVAFFYDLTYGLVALSDGLEQECRQIQEHLANIHQVLIRATGPGSESP